MRNRLFVAAVVSAVVAPLALAASSHADPTTTPNGPWPAANEQNLNAILGYDQLWDTLESIERRSHGAMTRGCSKVKPMKPAQEEATMSGTTARADSPRFALSGSSAG